MRDLARSMFAFPWALAMLSLQQVVDLVAPDGRAAGPTAAIEAVSTAAEGQLDGWLEQALQIGTTVQRGLVNLAKVRLPPLDSSGLLRVAGDRRLAPLFQATVEYGLPPIARIDALRVGGEDRAAVVQEFANKVRVLDLVAHVPAHLGLDQAGDEPLQTLLARATTLQSSLRLWAVEGVGSYYGDRVRERGGGADPQDLLTDASAAGLPAWSLTMLHAGIGRSFATAALARLDPAASPAVVRRGLTRFVAQCRGSSHRGYAGAALASLGLAARTRYPDLVPLLDREIPQVEPGLHGYFWHGAGRAMYLAPTNLLPASNAPKSAIVNLPQEAPHALAYRHALAGIAWAMTATNLQNPEVLEVFLRHHRALAVANDAFANGVSSAVMVQYDTMPGAAPLTSFMAHEPPSRDLAAAWRSLVASPCRVALERTYRNLRQAGALGELFHYRPSPA